MSFILSKILWGLAAPGNLLVLLLTVGTLLRLPNRPRLRRWGGLLISAAVGVLIALTILPLGRWLLEPLERRFPFVEPPARVDGIIVLGGAILPEISAAWNQPALNDAGERMTAFVALARRYPGARLVFSGGSGWLALQEHKEAPVARTLVDGLGLDPARVTFEGESRNTYENVLLSQAQVAPRPDEVWLLVTSAAHMPRSVGIFRKAGWPVVPYPVDFRTDPLTDRWLRFDLLTGLEQTHGALREWIGLVAYRLMGRTEALFPAPPENGSQETTLPSPRDRGRTPLSNP